MRARPLLTLLVVLLVVAGALGAAGREGRRATQDEASGGASAASAVPVAGKTVTATLPADKPVRAHVGDTVELRVRSATPDIAEMLEIGTRTPVGPALPGLLRFVAQAPGELPVRLELAGSTAGTVRVEAAR